MASRGLGVSLSGPHNDRHALDHALRGVRGADVAAQQEQRHEHEHQHEHQHQHQHESGQGSCCGAEPPVAPVAPAALSAATRREMHDRVWADEEVDMDPGLAQCCIKDLEDSEKSRRYRAALAKVDPVARVERLAQQAVATGGGGLGTRAGVSAREWAARAAQVPECQVRPAGDDFEEQQEDEEADSDAELDAFLDDYDPQAAASGADPGAEPCESAAASQDAAGSPGLTTVQRCSNARELATLLASTSGEDSTAAFIVLFGSEEQPELCEQISSELDRVLQLTTSGSEGLRLRAGAVDFDSVGASNPLLANSQWLKDKRFPLEPPFCVAFSAGSLEALFGFAKADLERGTQVIKSWWLSYAMACAVNNPKSKRKGDEDEDAEGEPASSYCGRPGCPRTFPHEHVQRLNKADEG